MAQHNDRLQGLTTLADMHRARAASLGSSWTTLTVFDPLHRGHEFVEELLAQSGLTVDVEDYDEAGLIDNSPGG